MIRAMYNGTSGMMAAQQGLSTRSNNIANSQTIGYKKQDVVFEEVLYQQFKTASGPTGNSAGTNPGDIGNGVTVSTIKTDFSSGQVNSTGGSLDAAIQGNGFFIVGNDQAENRMYTRAGNFASSLNNELVTQQGYYVLGWTADPVTGQINTTAGVDTIRVPVGEVGMPNQTTKINLEGNLNREDELGAVVGMQVKTYDSLGVAHNVDFNFVKTTNDGYEFVAVPTDQFRKSDSITSAIFRPNAENIGKLMKGEYIINTTAGATAGTVDVTVKDPNGNDVFTQNITDSDQTINIGDSDGIWFTIDYNSGAIGTPAKFVIGEIGDVKFDSKGNLVDVIGSGANGETIMTFTPEETNMDMDINLDFSKLTSLATDNNVLLKETDGYGSSTLMSYSITDGGYIQGNYNDGSVRIIAQIAVATFDNDLGLTKKGSGYYTTTPNSGEPNVGVSGTGQRGAIKAQSLESSNVDLAEEFVGLINVQKFYQGNSKVITVTQDVLDTVINLIR